MADPNEDLLEDGDIADGHFELDLADEDALLADDYDEKPMKSLRTTEAGRNHQNIEDEDFIEIGVDEDLALADESKNEGDTGKNSRKTIVFDDSNNDDSDEGGKERTRFKTERNINTVPRPTSAIPETLDAVAVKAQPNVGYNNRGARGGGIIVKRGFRGGFRGGFQRGIGQFRFRGPLPQHLFGPAPHMQIPKQPSIDVGQVQQQYHFSQVMNEQYNTPSEDCYQAPPTLPQPAYHPNPILQPPATNIHVNPHFRGPRPQVNQNLTMWNGTNYIQGSQNLQPTFQPAQPPYQNHYQSNQAPQWSEATSVNEYYPNQNAVTSGNNYGHGEQYYNGVNTGPEQYYQQQQQQQPVQSNYQPVGPSMGSNIAPQMNWNDNNYYGGQQTSPVSGPPQDVYNVQMNQQMNQTHPFNNRPQHHQHLQLQHKKVFTPIKKNHLFKNNKFQVGRGRGGKVLHMRKEPILQNKVTPPKPVRVETGALRKIQITNLHEVPVANTLVQKKNIPEPEEEDEEMKAYRKKIEEQKKLREQVLKQKEEKRKVAAQQKFQMLAAKKKNADEQAAASTSLHNANVSQQFRIVRVRLQDGRTVVKKLSTAQISKLKKISTGTTRPSVQVKNDSLPKSRIVVVDNLSASTTQKQLENMAKQMGKVERVKLNSDTKRATVIFENTMSAAAFVQKFQRKMVDLSMISLRMVTNADDNAPVTTTNSSNSGIGTVSTAPQVAQANLSSSSSSSSSLPKQHDQKNVPPTKLP